MIAEVIPYTLIFKNPGGTSRGILKTKDTWILKIQDVGRTGFGEVAMFRGLSYDDKPEFEQKLVELKNSIESGKELAQLVQEYIEWPSIRFGIEQAFASLVNEDPFNLIDSGFIKHKNPIAINGLVWMGDFEFMKSQIEEKIRKGFHCLKLKIGAINFDSEVELIENIRSSYSEKEIEIRVDANGAFHKNNALEKLKRLAKLQIHSIEQPIRQGQLEEMSILCSQTPLPIALDEELIGINHYDQKVELLSRIRPQYIILKPSLLGGWKSCDEWIEIAERLSINWWITSALESNIGLNAIAQYVSSKGTDMLQGLGTGELFINNFDSPLKVDAGSLMYCSDRIWNLDLLDRPKFHKSFTINGMSPRAFLNSNFKSDRLKAFQEELANFNSIPKFTFQTSGTTGEPTQIDFSLEQIKASALITHKTFNLFEGAIVGNALPLQYVASKMMLYRSIICGYALHIIEPDFDELVFNKLPDCIDFLPLVPIQVEKVLNFRDSTFDHIKTVLIGGANVSIKLKNRILNENLKTLFFESYGSTETLTHVAIKAIVEGETSFKGVEGVTFSSENGCLLIHAKHIQPNAIVTNDLVELTAHNSFYWLGRSDNVINSGGIKIIPEQLEEKLSVFLDSSFFIAAEPSELLGQHVILVVESAKLVDIEWSMTNLSKYEIPKKIYCIPQFDRTESGKILRTECLKRILV